MCGRFSLRALLDDVRRHLQQQYQIDHFADPVWTPRYNVAPGQKVLAVLNDGQKNRVGSIQWGYVPSYAKEAGATTGIINAKAETLAEKPLFQTALAHQRCVILADGFYEWKKTDSGKAPMRILMEDESIFPMAGIWNVLTRSDGTKVSSCAIITTSANVALAPIHDRMPAILTPENEKIWLNPLVTDWETLGALLRPYDPDKMQTYPVSPFVNNAKNDSMECIRRI